MFMVRMSVERAMESKNRGRLSDGKRMGAAVGKWNFSRAQLRALDQLIC